MRETGVCPKTPTEVEKASSSLGCPRDVYGNNQYMCLTNEGKSSLMEICHKGLMGLREKGNCLEVSDGEVITRSCKHFKWGCPDEPVDMQEYYKYQVCQAINTRDHCYSLDPSCPAEHTNSTDTTIITEIGSIDTNIVFYSILGLIIIVQAIFIILMLLERTKLRKGRRHDYEAHSKEERNDAVKCDGDHDRRQLVIENEECLVKRDLILTNVEDDDVFSGENMEAPNWIPKRKRNDTETSVESFSGG